MSVNRNTPQDKKTHGSISLNRFKSGAGEQFLLLDCRVRLRVKGMCLSDTGMITAAVAAAMITSDCMGMLCTGIHEHARMYVYMYMHV